VGSDLNTPTSLNVLGNPQSSRGLSRREILQKLAGGLGATIALPGVLSAHPIHKRLLSAALLNEADAKAQSPEWVPLFLSPHQNELFIALAERIVPGSTQAQVNRTVDLLLTVETEENQKAFVSALAAMDAESQQRFSSPFQILSPMKQDELLTAVSTGATAKSVKARRSVAKHADPFENLKGWIVGAYYASEIGMRELGWTDESYFEYTGCEHEDEHHS
jgi:Gluconate 2-dehydrogenase subunit 3